MNFEVIEGLQNDDITSLYDNIIESPDLVSPHWCCYGSDGRALMDWDWTAAWSGAVVKSVPGQEIMVSGCNRASYWNGCHTSNGWGHTQYLCNRYCHRSCDWHNSAMCRF